MKQLLHKWKQTAWVLLFLLTSVLGWGQTATITITNASIGGATVLGSNNYNSGAERVWTQSGVSFGGKAITCNVNNSPTSGSTACQYIQAQASNGVIYNTTALPGRIVSVRFIGTANVASTLTLGTTRLVNNTAGNYTVSGGTNLGSQTSTDYTWTTATSDNYNFFCIKRGSTAQYFSSIEVTYQTNQAPVASSVAISGNLKIGETLTGSYNYTDADTDSEGASTYKWYRADDATGTNSIAISGATATTYILQAADVNKYIRFGVVPVASAGTSPGVEAFSSW